MRPKKHVVIPGEQSETRNPGSLPGGQCSLSLDARLRGHDGQKSLDHCPDIKFPFPHLASVATTHVARALSGRDNDRQ